MSNFRDLNKMNNIGNENVPINAGALGMKDFCKIFQTLESLIMIKTD